MAEVRQAIGNVLERAIVKCSADLIASSQACGASRKSLGNRGPIEESIYACVPTHHVGGFFQYL